MVLLRASKALCVAGMALLVSLVAFGNITDYGTNLAFVQHVLTMDTIFPDATIRYRAIDSPALQRAAYWLIIAAEVLTAVAALICSATPLSAGDLYPKSASPAPPVGPHAPALVKTLAAHPASSSAVPKPEALLTRMSMPPNAPAAASM